MWFKFFNTVDRVRLWNCLVFSEGYFRRLSHSSLYKRDDLATFFNQKIAAPIEQEESALLESKQAVDLSALKESAASQKLQDHALTLSNEEQRAIRDKFYTPSVMREMWNIIKRRNYKSQVGIPQAKGTDAKLPKPEAKMMDKKDHI